MAEPDEVYEVLFQTVDEGSSVPSEIARLAMYERIERSYQVKREEKLETFDQALRNLLGMRSAKVTEEVIAKNLYNRFGSN